MTRPTINEHKIASQIAQTNDPQNHTIHDNQLAKIRPHRISKQDNNLIIHYKHERRLPSYKIVERMKYIPYSLVYILNAKQTR